MAAFPLEIWHCVFSELRTIDDPRGTTHALQALSLTCRTFSQLAQAQLFRTVVIATYRIEKYGRAVRLTQEQFRRALQRLAFVCQKRLSRAVEEVHLVPRQTVVEYLERLDWRPDDPFTYELLDAFFQNVYPRLPGLKHLRLTGVLLRPSHMHPLHLASPRHLTIEGCLVDAKEQQIAKVSPITVSRLALGTTRKYGWPSPGRHLSADLYTPFPDHRTLQSLSCTGRTEQATLLQLMASGGPLDALHSIELHDGDKLDAGNSPLQDWRCFLADRCPNLEQLAVHASAQEGFADPKPYPIPSLKTFRASWGGCSRLYLDVEHPRLQHITFEGDPLASDNRLMVEDRDALGAELRSIEQTCARLESLAISVDARSRYRFSSRDLTQIRKSCPNLKTLRVEARPYFLSIRKVLRSLRKAAYPLSLQTFLFEPRLVLSDEEERTFIDEIPSLATHLRSSSPNLTCVVIAYSSLGGNKLQARYVAFNAATGERLFPILDW